MPVSASYFGWGKNFGRIPYVLLVVSAYYSLHRLVTSVIYNPIKLTD